MDRSARDGRSGWPRRCGAVLYRGRCDPRPGRLAQGRRHPARLAQRSSAIRDHLVFARGRGDRDLSAVATPRCRRIPAMITAYPELEARFRRLGTVEETVAMLHWDAAALKPPGAAPSRAE